MEINAGLLRHPSPISIDGSEACEYFPYVFKGPICSMDEQIGPFYFDST
jgi:hypothetical protein